MPRVKGRRKSKVSVEVLVENAIATFVSMILFSSGRGICLNVFNEASVSPTLPSMVSYAIVVLSIIIMRLLWHPRPLSWNCRTVFMAAIVLIPDVLSYVCYGPALQHFEKQCEFYVRWFYNVDAKSNWELFCLKWITASCFTLGPAMILLIVQLSLFWTFLHCLYLITKVRKFLLKRELKELRKQLEARRSENSSAQPKEEKEEKDEQMKKVEMHAQMDKKLVILGRRPKRQGTYIELVEESQC